MQFLVYLWYPVLLGLLFWKARFSGKNLWNDEVLSLGTTKALQGFCAVAIVFHHLAQNTCAPWINPTYLRHGLDVFVPIGYLLVAVFFFCSGFGLYKSFKSKPDYLKGFCERRVEPLLFFYLAIELLYLIVRINMQGGFSFAFPINPYAWYIVTILFLYLCFNWSFRIKKETTAIIVLCLFVLGYFVFCNFIGAGTWWYNSVPAFVVGIVFAKNQDRIIEAFKKKYILWLCLSIILFALTFVFSENATSIFPYFSEDFSITVMFYTTLICQMVASSVFVIILVLIGLKVKIGNPALSFLGSLTLEIYLLQGLALNLFGFCFINENFDSLIYIKNVFLYALVVLAITIPLAWLVQKIKNIIENWRLKADYRQKIRKVVKIVFIVIGAIFVLVVFFSIRNSLAQTKRIAPKVAAYEQENITSVKVNGKKMAARIAGEGENTYVFLGFNKNYPAPTISMWPFAKRFAVDNHVVILDYFGDGFSEKSDEPRNASAIADEIHLALEALGEKGPFIFVPVEGSGLNVIEYLNKYPSEVKAIIGINMYLPKGIDVERKATGQDEKVYKYWLSKRAKFGNVLQDLMRALGFIRMEAALIEGPVSYGHGKQNLDEINEVLIASYQSKNGVEAYKNRYDDGMKFIDFKFPSDLPVLFLCDFVTDEYKFYGIDWDQLYKDYIVNPEIQKTIVANGDPYFLYYNFNPLSEMALKFINSI